MGKKIIFSLVLIGGLVFFGAGCAPQEPAENVNANTNATADESIEEENVNIVNPGVTEEELNELKLEIKGMDYEDLNEFNN
jgi:hypothetical protein